MSHTKRLVEADGLELAYLEGQGMNQYHQPMPKPDKGWIAANKGTIAMAVLVALSLMAIGIMFALGVISFNTAGSSGSGNGGGLGDDDFNMTTSTSTTWNFIPWVSSTPIIDTYGRIKEMDQLACSTLQCKQPDCQCAGNSDPPGNLPVQSTPQLVLLSFDGAINDENYRDYLSIFNMRNPNGCKATGSFFVSHKYTNYRQVQELYKRGHDIGSNTIRRTFTTKLWRHEINGMKELLKYYAYMPDHQVKGFRAPFLQVGGDAMYEVLANEGFLYDASLPSYRYVNPPMYPYTLEYKSDDYCVIGPCPKNNSYVNLWEVPILTMSDDNGNNYRYLHEFAPASEKETFEFLKLNFLRHYESSRAPLSLAMISKWFVDYPWALRGLQRFMEYTKDFGDVWFVSHHQAIKFMKEPKQSSTAYSLFKCDARPPGQEPCKESEEKVCEYMWDDGSYVYMVSCNPDCPARYPWVYP